MEQFQMDEENQEQSRFVIDSDQKAQWAMDKIRQAQADTKKWADFYADRLNAVQKENQATIDYMTMLLREYFASVPHKATKTQESYALPGGKLMLKVQAPEFIRDETALTAWAEASAPDLIRTKITTDWAALKKRCEISAGQVVDRETGEVVPGVTVEIRDPVFRVEVEG